MILVIQLSGIYVAYHNQEYDTIQYVYCHACYESFNIKHGYDVEITMLYLAKMIEGSKINNFKNRWQSLAWGSIQIHLGPFSN